MADCSKIDENFYVTVQACQLMTYKSVGFENVGRK